VVGAGGKEKEKNGPDKPQMCFEENLETLEKAVSRLEEGNLSLDDSLRLYEEGIAAYRWCHQALEETELKIRKLVETLEGELKEEPLEPPQEEP